LIFTNEIHLYFFEFIYIYFLHTVDQNDAFSLLSSLSRPAGGTPATQASNGAATGKQLDLNNNAFGGLIGGIFNQALSNLARPANNGGGVNSGLGIFGNPQAWANFGANPQGVPFQQQPGGGGGDVSFPGKVTLTTTTTKATTTSKTKATTTSKAKATTTAKAMNSKLTTTTKNLPTEITIINLADVPGW
jgi:hypothetical protein